MNWRWISLAALLAAVVVGYGAFNERRASRVASSGPPPLPGYYLGDAVITETQPDGSLRMRVVAERIEQRPRDDAIVIHDVRVNYFQTPGREWTLTSERAVIPADSQVVQFEGDVHLRPAETPGAFLRTDALALDTQRNVAYALNAPAALQFGQHAMTVRNFTADLDAGTIRLESVNGRFQAP